MPVIPETARQWLDTDSLRCRQLLKMTRECLQAYLDNRSGLVELTPAQATDVRTQYGAAKSELQNLVRSMP